MSTDAVLDPASEATPFDALSAAPPPAVSINAPNQAELARKLRSEMAAVRLARGKWGISKRLDQGQITASAAAHGADSKFISASKKLIQSKNEKYGAPCATLREAAEYWKSVTIPYPEDGVRLIRRDRLDAFVAQMQQLKVRLRAEARELDENYQELISEARERLGDLFKDDDYPADVGHLFRLDWDFPSVEPPAYLLQISPALYEQQEQMIQARFAEAIRLTEEAFAEQFQKLVAHIAERLQPGEDGKAKVFKASAVDGLREFFDQFKALSVGSNPQLDELVEQAKQIVGSVDPKLLRKNAADRDALGRSMAEIASKLDGLVVAKPLRQMNLGADE